jgi:hypothetical protein
VSAYENEVDRLANDLAGDWRERAEKAEAEVTAWKTRLVEETARLRGINQEAMEAAERWRAVVVAAYSLVAHDAGRNPDEMVQELREDLHDALGTEVERA